MRKTQLHKKQQQRKNHGKTTIQKRNCTTVQRKFTIQAQTPIANQNRKNGTKTKHKEMLKRNAALNVSKGRSLSSLVKLIKEFEETFRYLLAQLGYNVVLLERIYALTFS